MNISEVDHKHCTGCSLCAAICPQKAISMAPDAEGFAFPKVDSEKCIGCGKCTSMCPQLGESVARDLQKREVYACQALNGQRLISATAGALFPTLADEIISIGGTVYGAAYDEEMKVVHCRACSSDKIETFSGSKYVQSDIYRALPQIKKDLQAGKSVLFSGTPCQVEAVKRYCNDTDTTRLYTMDVICYGVPSPGLFRAYLDSVEQENHGKVVDFRFRDKRSNGWSHTTVITLRNKENQTTVIEEPDYYKIPYYRMFGARNCYRRSCYSCKYNTLRRVSDITTGNFWGIENISETFQTTLGVSMAILNTVKGKELFFAVKDKLVLEKRTEEEAIRANEALVVTGKYPPRRDAVYRCFQTKGFDRTIKKHYTKRWYHGIRRCLGRLKERSLKMLLGIGHNNGKQES